MNISLPDDWIYMYVGDYVFFTTKSTLSINTFFRNFLKNNESNVLYIDRDGKHFRFILNFLRGSSVLPKDENDLEELQLEADFYCLDDMKTNIENKLFKLRRIPSIERTLFDILSIMKC